MKVGNSPVYFIPGQERLLENFSQYLKSKEKEAFLLLKEKRFLKDNQQEPAIRVALREIKDFAIPFKKPETDELFWRYFTIPESEFKEQKEIPKKTPKPEKKEKQESEISGKTTKVKLKKK